MEESDLELFRRAKGGKTAAFNQLVERHAPALIRAAAGMIGRSGAGGDGGTEAEDVVQETFTAAYRSMRSFQEKSSVKTWLYAILIRQVALFRRKNKMPLRFFAEESALAGAGGGRGDDEGGHEEAVDARLDVEAAMARLPEDHRAILIMREFDGMSYEEIAEVLGVPRGTVESRIFRARQAMKEWLGVRSEKKEGV